MTLPIPPKRLKKANFDKAMGTRTAESAAPMPTTAVRNTPMTAAVFMMAPAVSGFFAAQSLNFSLIPPIHLVSSFNWGATDSPILAKKLVNVPLAASQRLASVPSWSLTR